MPVLEAGVGGLCCFSVGAASHAALAEHWQRERHGWPGLCPIVDPAPSGRWARRRWALQRARGLGGSLALRRRAAAAARQRSPRRAAAAVRRPASPPHAPGLRALSPLEPVVFGAVPSAPLPPASWACSPPSPTEEAPDRSTPAAAAAARCSCRPRQAPEPPLPPQRHADSAQLQEEPQGGLEVHAQSLTLSEPQRQPAPPTGAPRHPLMGTIVSSGLRDLSLLHSPAAATAAALPEAPAPASPAASEGGGLADAAAAAGAPQLASPEAKGEAAAPAAPAAAAVEPTQSPASSTPQSAAASSPGHHSCPGFEAVLGADSPQEGENAANGSGLSPAFATGPTAVADFAALWSRHLSLEGDAAPAGAPPQ
eukprot:TRINITY_DN7718_c1_g1_i3.p2 TRINITY_DN7718_c1_g1~~TRINITY_DN7718_c1_g1_i3.p2  ORF type:complete len:368 (+),score=68.71 TRINITY_DN7718_c1_g1_i3:163-1266(+)